MRLTRRSTAGSRRRLFQRASLALLCAVAAAAEPAADGAPAADSVQAYEQVLREAALVDARAALGAVDEMIAAGRAQACADRLASARARLVLMSGTEVETLATQLDAARRRCLDSSAVTGTEQRSADRVQSLAQADEQRGGNITLVRDIFAERQARIRGLVDRGQLELALAACRRLVADYPHEPEAERFFNDVLTRAHEHRRLTIVERNRELRQELNERIERSLIPTCYDGMPLFPGDWLDRVLARDQGQQVDIQVPEWEERIQARLAERIPVDYVQMLPSEILQDIGRRTQLNLLIDPSVYAIDKALPAIRARNLTIGSALNWICTLANIKWGIAGGGVRIGGEIDPAVVTGSYSISEVMFGGRDQPGRVMGLAPPMAGEGGAGAGGANLFAAAPAAAAGITADAMVDLIKKAISPSTWQRPDCSLTVHGTTLLAQAPARVHQHIRQFIRSRSQLQTIMVHLDMRWLEVADGFMEEIGVDWTSGNLGTNPIGAANAPHYDGLYHGGGSHANNGSITNTMPASMASFASPSTVAGTGLKLSGALLKTLHLNAIASAVERKDRASLLSSPSLTTINGVRSSCIFGQQTAYIAGYDIRGGGGGGRGSAFDPRIASLFTGAVLDVKPLVSADGKYVRLDIVPQLADMVMYQDGITTFQDLGGGAYDDLGNYTTVGRTMVMPIELPMVRLKSAATTSHIPHGGTLLLGGFGRHLDQTASTKVPFLGNIPFLGRLFGMRGRYSDRRQLYLLITVNIHNYQELEATK